MLQPSPNGGRRVSFEAPGKATPEDRTRSGSDRAVSEHRPGFRNPALVVAKTFPIGLPTGTVLFVAAFPVHLFSNPRPFTEYLADRRHEHLRPRLGLVALDPRPPPRHLAGRTLRSAAMRSSPNLALAVGWRVAVTLLVFNPIWSVSHWLAANWQSQPGIALIVTALVFVLFLYMLSIVRDFPGATAIMALLIAAILGGAALQGWLDPFDLAFWKWAAPLIAALLFSAGPIFASVRRREAGIATTDETPT